MQKQVQLWSFIREYQDETPPISDGKRKGEQPKHFEFLPLTEEDKKEYSAELRRCGLMDKESALEPVSPGKT